MLWQQAIGAVAGSPESTITGMDYSLELEALLICLSTGELLQLAVAQQLLEEVGSVEGGLQALAWSPDGEVFVAVSGTGNLLLMNQVHGLPPLIWHSSIAHSRVLRAVQGTIHDTNARWHACSHDSVCLQEFELNAEVSLGAAPPGREHDSSWWADVTLSWRGDGKFLATSHRIIKEGWVTAAIVLIVFSVHFEPCNATDLLLVSTSAIIFCLGTNACLKHPLCVLDCLTQYALIL